MNEKLKKLFQLFYVFLKIGAFTFGGGYAMIPLISREVADSRKWITKDDILDIIAIAESTPGPIAINAATFVGYKVSGFFGAMFTTLGVTLPSVIIITIISFVLDAFSDIQAVQFAFMGIRAGVLALIIKALISMYKQCPKGAIAYFVMGFSFVAVAVFDVNVLITLIICAVIGLVSSIAAKRRIEK